MFNKIFIYLKFIIKQILEILYILFVELLLDIIYTYYKYFIFILKKKVNLFMRNLKKKYIKIFFIFFPSNFHFISNNILFKLPSYMFSFIWLYSSRFYLLIRFIIEPFWLIGAFFALLIYIRNLLNRFIFSGFHPMKRWQIFALLVVLFILLSQFFIFVLSLSSMLVFLRLVNNLINIYFDRIKWNDKVMGRIKS